MTEYDPKKFMWRGKRVSDLSTEEAHQIICELCERERSSYMERRRQVTILGVDAHAAYQAVCDDDGKARINRSPLAFWKNNASPQ